MSRPAFFITGTDTNVGKTEAACLLARSFREAGYTVGVMKPVETGCPVLEGTMMPQDALRLKEASGTKTDIDLVNPYRFAPPLSPHLAARLSGTSVDLVRIKEIFTGIRAAHDMTLVEGAGGLLAPVTEEKTMADLALLLGLPLIIVAADRLGTLNHTLLTVRCAREMGLPIKGIILNNPVDSSNDPSSEYNRGDIERLTGLPVIFEVAFSPEQSSTPCLDRGVIEKLLTA